MSSTDLTVGATGQQATVQQGSVPAQPDPAVTGAVEKTKAAGANVTGRDTLDGRGDKIPSVSDKSTIPSAKPTPGEPSKAAKPTTEADPNASQGLMDKALGLLETIFGKNPIGFGVLAALSLLPAFFPGISAVVWGVIGLVMLGTAITDAVTRDSSEKDKKDAQPFAWGLGTGGLLMIGAGFLGSPYLAAIGGFTALVLTFLKDRHWGRHGGRPGGPGGGPRVAAADGSAAETHTPNKVEPTDAAQTAPIGAPPKEAPST